MTTIEIIKSMGALSGIAMVMLGSGWMKQCIRKNLFCHCKCNII